MLADPFLLFRVTIIIELSSAFEERASGRGGGWSGVVIMADRLEVGGRLNGIRICENEHRKIILIN